VGTLHERNASLWVATSAPPTFPSLVGDREVDVAIVGAGITGLTLARKLVEEGVSLCLIEAGSVGAGATGYTTAKVTALHRLVYRELMDRHGRERAGAYAAANQAAIEEIARFVGADAIDCAFTRAPAYTYTEQASDVTKLEAERDAARELGVPVELTDETELPYEVRAALRLDRQAHFHPHRYCLALASAITDKGGEVFEHTRATGVERRDRGCVVTTAHGKVRADRAVLATHLPFPNDGAFFARAHATRSYALAARLAGPEVMGMYITAEEPTRSIRPAGEWTIIGGEGHKTGHDDHTAERYSALEQWARDRFDVSSVEFRWSAQDYVTADGMPFVGPISGRNDRVLVATGFRKWGMTNGTAAAVILTDVIAGRPNAWLRAFDSTRRAPRASITQFVRDNLDVGKRLVGDRLSALRARPAEDLRPGQGDIADMSGAKVAAYRDDDGTLHALRAQCTHLGCLVTFNDAERTWDCPCHGSRFDLQGRVIEGPAVEDLARVEPAGTAGADSDV
jgi:glycine/D-amino acid oxidase-like deaminating enzyme/nitrite reductase/ring-hydroxylating ferredoxin subunit